MIQIDAKDIIDLSKKLSNASRSTFPVAVRSTLNDMAFDVKKNQLIQTLKNKSGMIIRNESFFKKYSGFQKATGFEISSMYSQVGMIPSGNATRAVNRLETQDEGGNLINHDFVPDKNARQGNSRSGKVQKNKYLDKIKLIAKVNWGDKQQLIREVAYSNIRNGQSSVNGNSILYGNIVYKILSFKRIRSNDTIKLHFKKLYTYEKNRKINVKPHRFMEKSAIPEGKNMQQFFNSNIEKQLKRQGL